MPSDALPQVSEPSTYAVDPCAAARCTARAVTAVVLRIGSDDVDVRCCDRHARDWTATSTAEAARHGRGRPRPGAGR